MAFTLIVSPCGTSVLTNGASSSDNKALLNETANCSEQELEPAQKQQLEAFITQQAQAILSADVEEAKRRSAELNGILSYYNNQIPPKTDIHILLATATYQGQRTAQIIADWLKKQGCQAQIAAVSPDLNVRSTEELRLGMAELARWAAETLPGYRDNQYKIVFNLTGGFKSVNGFLQTLGMFYADECVYIFQNSELIRIPRLPIKLDPEGIIDANLSIFRRLAQGQNLSVGECSAIPETLLFILDERVSGLSEWGELVWNQCKKDYYSKQLLEPISPKIRYSETFRKTVAALPPERKVIINEQLDKLSHCLENPQKHNPDSLGFKALKSNSCPPSTHECNAWSDLDAKRIFAHFENGNGILIIDKLDKGLH